MTRPFIPADRVMAHGMTLDELTVRTSDDREVGSVLGLVIDPSAGHAGNIVVECRHRRVEVPLGSARLDPHMRALRLVDRDAERTWREFHGEIDTEFDEEDLIAVLFRPAAA